MVLPDSTRLGKYVIRSLLGAGAMGQVYLAHDTVLHRPVALKVLPSEFTTDTDRLQRFKREAYAASSLNHPNILTIYEIGAEGDVNYMVTEYIDGESLRRRMARSPLSLAETLDIGIQAALGLSAAHDSNIVHRDIKPENIMLRRDGIVKVLDFGLAKSMERESPPLDTRAPTQALVQTDPGTVMGTMSYMSPEQVRASSQIDSRTDIWSLGVVLYEMAAGSMPFHGESPNDVIAAILRTEPQPLRSCSPDVPEELEHIVERTLHKKKEERYESAKDLISDLKILKQQLEFDSDRGNLRPAASVSGNRRRSSGGVRDSLSTAPTAPAIDTREARRAETESGIQSVLMTLKRHKPATIIGVLGLLMIAAGVIYYYMIRQKTAPDTRAAIESIAVLPLVNTTRDPATEFLADGISDGLINNLSQLPQLKVIARASSFRYKGQEIDVQEVGKALGVQAVVIGRVAKHGDDLQINIELVDARDKTQIWGDQYSRKATDLQAVQQEIARRISDGLRLRLTPAQERQLTKRTSDNPEAYELYLNGVFYYNKGGLENGRKALASFEQAIVLDPKCALAYTGVALIYNAFGGSGVVDPAVAMPKARDAIKKALELDDTRAEPHAVLGLIKRNEWDWPGAEGEYKRAIEINPSFSSAHGAYAVYLSEMGRHTEALDEIKLAQELDPLRIAVRNQEGSLLQNARRYDEAIKQFQNVLMTEPEYSTAHEYLGYTYAAKGLYADAIGEYRKFIELEGETTSVSIYLGYAYARSGKTAEARAILNKLKTSTKYVSPAELAVLYVGLADKEGAFALLERAFTAHDLQLQYLKVDAHYDPIRSDPRFVDLMRRVGLPI